MSDPRRFATRGGRPAAAGFTLLEVMMALVVLGIAVLSLASVFGLAAGRTHSQSVLSEDIVVCQSKMKSCGP